MSDSRKLVDEDLGNIDPDDLFVRFSISEIKTIQSRLRADADAKQEELRLMVGERYRDLLQASTSIISIADSSRRVVSALAEMREAMAPDEPHKKPRSASIRGKDDVHLKVLQSLSAHLKLLLDAPEHLWRLLEKKQHLQAAWLFMLARVVHRALVTEDTEEESWQKEGINVVTQFPLVQRQWDVVAQFRPQIAHRATQYLRERSISSECACSAVLTLHLLDALPLTETLSTLLSQRSRTLNALLMRNLDSRSHSRPGSPIFNTRPGDREVAGLLLSPPTTSMLQWPGSRKVIMRNVREVVLELMDIIWRTMRTARDIFQSNGGEGRKSLAEQFLEDIQSDALSGSVLTTPSLLSTLPSSTHLLTLPPSILSYKPYLDLTSPSTRVEPATLDAKLSVWFDKAMQGFEGRVQVWFAGLESIREVWDLRRKIMERLRISQGLDEYERVQIQKVLDRGVNERISEVASAALEDLEKKLDDILRKAVQDVRNEVEGSRFDVNPSTFLFSAPPIPSLSQTSISPGSAASPFKLFKDALRQRVNGRTPLLDRVLSEVERKAQDLEEDLGVMSEDNDKSRDLRDTIMSLYHQMAPRSSGKILKIVEQLMTEEIARVDKEPYQTVDMVLFIGRFCYYLTTSPCIQSLCFPYETAEALRVALTGLHERSLAHWREYAISKALAEYDSAFVSFDDTPENAELAWPSQPSPQLTSAFLSLISLIYRLGLTQSKVYTKGVIDQALWDFQSAVAGKVSSEDHMWRRKRAQLLWDLTFLQRLNFRQNMISEESKPEKSDNTLTAKLSLFREHLRSTAPENTLPELNTHINHTIDQYMQRSQTLLSPLLITISRSQKAHANGHTAESAATTPRVKPTALLPLGAPEGDQDFRPAMETVKPSARFGLLLVGSTAIR